MSRVGGGGSILPLVTNDIEFENRNAIILYYVLYFQRMNIGITLCVQAHLGPNGCLMPLQFYYQIGFWEKQ